MWTKETLQQVVTENLKDYKFVIVSNRQPYQHFYNKGEIQCRRGAGGVISALDPVMKACGGTWVAFGNDEADRQASDANGIVRVPENDPKYTLRRVFLNKEEELGYYYGYSNQAIWPLCHTVFQRPVFKQADWEHYVNVNRKFAKAVLDDIGTEKAFIWIQDYHLCLLPKFLKEAAGDQVSIAYFWHVPWPSYEAFRICPQKAELLEGLLSSDLIGFHIQYHCSNFTDVINRELECKIDQERHSITRAGHETLIRTYPISVDFKDISTQAALPEVQQNITEVIKQHNLKNLKVMLGVDRIDYTKGIPERLLAVDRLFEEHPELIGKATLLQIGQPTRIHIPRYKELNDEINALVEATNWKYQKDGWKPIIFVRGHFGYKDLLALFQLAQVCIISSLHDGMNLVSKEFISSRNSNDGVLLLSCFTGAARELTDAIQINPFDRDDFAKKIHQALVMSPQKQQTRMKRLRKSVERHNIYRWAGNILSDFLKLEFNE